MEEDQAGVPPLFRCLGPVFHQQDAPAGLLAAPWSGPRRWWAGPLDVEGLGLGSVGAAAAALNLLAGVPGRFATTSALTAGAFDSSGHLRVSGHPIQGFAPLSGFRRTLDGWIRLHANYPHHEQRLMEALGATTADGVAAALRSMESLEAEAAIQSRGGVAAAVRTRADWLASAMGRSAGTGPWIDVTLPGGKAKRGGEQRRRLAAGSASRPGAGPRHRVRPGCRCHRIARAPSARRPGRVGAPVPGPHRRGTPEPPRTPRPACPVRRNGMPGRAASRTCTPDTGQHIRRTSLRRAATAGGRPTPRL